MSRANLDEPQQGAKTSRKPTSILAKSAQGATFLILLQVGSRALTFIVNQVLLRYLSPEILGISTQLELFAISVLYFSRESLRVALQRQRSYNDQAEPCKEGTGNASTPEKTVISHAPGRRAQEAVNLSYIAIGLGLPLAYLFAKFYIRSADPHVLRTPYIHESLNIYALASFVELLNEPNFAVAQQQMLYGTRASAETFATSTRCIVTCSSAIWASRTGSSVGALPFALGQLSYAIVLNLLYISKMSILCSRLHFSYLLTPLPSSPSLFLSRFSLPHLTLALNLYAQSTLKHILTTGDSLLIAALTPLPSQGAYALASNYGSLLARILFQPLEESSRSLFGRILPSFSASLTPAEHRNLNYATSYLRSLLHLYALISLLSVSLGPTLAPLLLRVVAGPRWAETPAAAVLAAYCYYIPLLALNGILEAFVSAVATPAQLRRQSAWMFAFSAAFATTGILVLRVWDLGARGLVLANAINMALRIWWSWGFVKGYVRAMGGTLRLVDMLPSAGSGLGALAAAYGLRAARQGFEGDMGDLLKWAGVAGGYGLLM